jgi:hypothetical protein
MRLRLAEGIYIATATATGHSINPFDATEETVPDKTKTLTGQATCRIA